MSRNRYDCMDYNKSYSGRHHRSDRDNGNSDKHHHGWEADKGRSRRSERDYSFERSESDSKTSQKRKAYGRPHTDMLAKKPRYDEPSSKSEKEVLTWSSFQSRKKSETATKKSSSIPLPYAHLPPSPPRYAKPNETKARLLQPPTGSAGIKIAIAKTNNSEINTNPPVVNLIDDNETIETGIDNFPQNSNSTAERNINSLQSSSQIPAVINKLQAESTSKLSRFTDIVGCKPSLRKLASKPTKITSDSCNPDSERHGQQKSAKMTNQSSNSTPIYASGVDSKSQCSNKPINIDSDLVGNKNPQPANQPQSSNNRPIDIKSSNESGNIKGEQSSYNTPASGDVATSHGLCSEQDVGYSNNAINSSLHLQSESIDFNSIRFPDNTRLNNQNTSHDNINTLNTNAEPKFQHEDTQHLRNTRVAERFLENKANPQQYNSSTKTGNFQLFPIDISTSIPGSSIDNGLQTKCANRFDRCVSGSSDVSFVRPPYEGNNGPRFDNIAKAEEKRFSVPPPNIQFGNINRPLNIAPPPFSRSQPTSRFNNAVITTQCLEGLQNNNPNRFNDHVVRTQSNRFENTNNNNLNRFTNFENGSYVGNEANADYINNTSFNNNRFSKNTGHFNQFGNNSFPTQRFNTNAGNSQDVLNNGNNLFSNERFNTNTGNPHTVFNNGNQGFCNTLFNRSIGSRDSIRFNAQFETNRNVENNTFHMNNDNRGCNSNGFNQNVGNYSQYPNRNENNKNMENKTFKLNNGNQGFNNNRFNRNFGDFPQHPNRKGNGVGMDDSPQFDSDKSVENKVTHSITSSKNYGNFDSFTENKKENTSQVQGIQFEIQENPNTLNNGPNNANVQQLEGNSQSQENLPRNVTSHSNEVISDYGKNLQFGMKRRTGIKSDYRQLDQHFGNKHNLLNNTQRDNGFQINPPLYNVLGGGGSGNQHFYEDINPAPPVEDIHNRNVEHNSKQEYSSPHPTNRRLQGFTARGRGNVRQFGNNSGTRQMRKFNSNNNCPPGHNQQIDNRFSAGRPFNRNQQLIRGRGRGRGGHFNRLQTGFNKNIRFSGGNQNAVRGIFVNNSHKLDIIKNRLAKKTPGDVKQPRFGKIRNNCNGKLLKKAKNKIVPKVHKDQNAKEKKKSLKKLKKSKKPKDGEQKPEVADHVDINKKVFGDFQPIVVGQKKPPKGHLKPEPATYWQQWWSLYGYVEKSLAPIDANDESVHAVLKFKLIPSDSEYRKRKRTLLVMGVAKILRHIRLNESDYAMRDIFNVLKYKHQLEDPQFQQHLSPKEMERVERILKHARKKTRRALFYQSMICRWHFSTLIIRRAENGENLKCGHARKLISDKAFNYLVWESIQELKKLTLEDWPEFDEFYKTL